MKHDPASRHVQLTAEAFQELVEGASEHLIDNCEGCEIHDIRTWRRKLLASIDTVANYSDPDGVDSCGPPSENN